MKQIGLVLLVALALLAPVGCSDSSPSAPTVQQSHTYTFVNSSSYTISVVPNGQSWQGFYLGVGETRALTTMDPKLYMLYSPANAVWGSMAGGTVTFYNR